MYIVFAKKRAKYAIEPYINVRCVYTCTTLCNTLHFEGNLCRCPKN